MPNPVVHWEIQSTDPARSWKFYRRLFGWPLPPAGHPAKDYGFAPPQAPAGITGSVCGNGGAARSRVTFYVEVADLPASLGRALELGGQTVMPPRRISDVCDAALFADPEGNVIGLISNYTPPQ